VALLQKMTSNTSHPMSLCHPVSLSSYSPLLSDVFHDSVLTPLNFLFARASHVLFCVRARMYKCTCACASHPFFLHTLKRVRLKTRRISDHNAQRIQGSFAEYVWIFNRIYRALLSEIVAFWQNMCRRYTSRLPELVALSKNLTLLKLSCSVCLFWHPTSRKGFEIGLCVSEKLMSYFPDSESSV